MSNSKAGKKIDVDQIDLERMGEMTTQNPGTIAFPHTVGGAMIKPEDKGKIKGRALSAMYDQTEMDMKQIYEQMQLLADQAKTIQNRVSVSERVYQARMSFDPIISRTYHLYQKNDGTDLLSLVSPEEWGKNCPYGFIATVKLLADHTWDVIKEGDIDL